MNRLKLSLPVALAGLGAALLSVEIGFLRREQMHTGKALAVLEQKRQERDRLWHLSPAPSTENEKAIADALAEAARTLAVLRGELVGNPTPGAVPAGPVDAFFDLSRFGEVLRQKAAEEQVAVRTAEHFGFSSYTNEGPAAELLPAIHRQHTTAGSILEVLLEARPLALLAFKRERPRAMDGDKPDRGVEDYFTLPRECSLRQPGLVDMDAFRVEFTGPTAVLRQFLNALAGAPQAMVVRTVEVEPFRATAPGAAGGEVVALHRPQISKFTVTLETPLVARAGASP